MQQKCNVYYPDTAEQMSKILLHETGLMHLSKCIFDTFIFKKLQLQSSDWLSAYDTKVLLITYATWKCLKMEV